MTAGNSFVETQTIQKSPLGAELSPAQCERLAAIATSMCLRQDHFLLEEGHKDDQLHIITKGTLAVVKAAGGGDHIVLQILHQGDLAGELGFIDNVEHSAAIKALTDAEIFSISRTDLETLIEQDPGLVYKVMRAIIRTVHQILYRMNVQFVEMQNYIYKQHGRY